MPEPENGGVRHFERLTMTVLDPIRYGAVDIERGEILALVTKVQAWLDDPSKRLGSPLGYCLFVACRDTLGSAIESVGQLTRSTNTNDSRAARFKSR
jgi:hypothetical protein